MHRGPGAVPASWPSANRYTEAIFIQLFSVLPRNRTKFDNVTRAYYDIRQLVLQNGRVMSETNIQLPEISRGTLTQWYTKRGKALDKLVLEQGVRFFKPSQTTSHGIPVALDKPAQLPTGRTEPHVFPCPSNTAGLARFKGQKKISSCQLKVVARQSTTAQSTDTEAPESAYPYTTLKPTSIPTASQSTSPFTATASISPISVPLSISRFTAPRQLNQITVNQSTSSFTAPRSTYPIPAPQFTSVAASQSMYFLTGSQAFCPISALIQLLSPGQLLTSLSVRQLIPLLLQGQHMLFLSPCQLLFLPLSQLWPI